MLCRLLLFCIRWVPTPAARSQESFTNFYHFLLPFYYKTEAQIFRLLFCGGLIDWIVFALNRSVLNGFKLNNLLWNFNYSESALKVLSSEMDPVEIRLIR
jgi:hypothetical protein